jgi:hypothetical protein
MPEASKICRHCHESLPLRLFYRRRINSHSAWCKPCSRALGKLQWRRHRESLAAANQASSAMSPAGLLEAFEDDGPMAPSWGIGQTEMPRAAYLPPAAEIYNHATPVRASCGHRTLWTTDGLCRECHISRGQK